MIAKISGLRRIDLKANIVDGHNPPAREQPAPGEGLADMGNVEQRRTHGSPLPFTAKQATRCPGADSIISGTRRLQTSIASGHRG